MMEQPSARAHALDERQRRILEPREIDVCPGELVGHLGRFEAELARQTLDEKIDVRHRVSLSPDHGAVEPDALYGGVARGEPFCDGQSLSPELLRVPFALRLSGPLTGHEG